MILRTILLLTFLRLYHARPQDNIKLPNLEVSSAEEVNSLEADEPFNRESKRLGIEDTVQEVENIIKSNPVLPRLTRGEILDLLENITQRDEQKVKILNQYRDPKAIMVVMPYTPTNDKNLEDFYTKAPVTRIVGEPPRTEETPKHSRRRPPVKNDTDNDLKPLPEEVKKYSASISEKPAKPSPMRNQVRRRRPELSTPTTKTTTTTTTTTATLPTTYRPKTRRRRPTTTTQHPNHKYEEDFPSHTGIRIIESPKLTSLEDMMLEESVKIKHNFPSTAALITTPSTTVRPTTTHSLSEEFNIPSNLKSVVQDMNLKSALNPPAEKIRPSFEEENKIKNLLASIGALQETTTTTTTSMPDAAIVAESLSPDMRDLLMSFGLLPNTEVKPPLPDPGKYYPEKAEVKAESYIGFKPLPDDGPSRDDMEALLASFGLGRSARKQKALKTEEIKPYNFDMIPDNLKDVIKDLGLEDARKENKKIQKPQHIFNPEDTQYASEEELKKLEQLIDMIKKLEKINGTIKEDDLKTIDVENLTDLVTSLNNHNDSFVTLDQKGPDPNDFDTGLIKNEVKRQESTTVSATTAEAETPSIKDLEASFGGKPETSTEAELPETTTKIKTGFYYLVDWNTFLDIDDTKGKRVNLRFQPTIGDPKRFLSVSVP